MDYEEEEDFDTAGIYNEDEYNKFVSDMRQRGWSVEDYHGRFFYHGPAVRVEDDSELQEAIRSTDIPVQWDNLGMGWIVYPQ